MPLFGHQGVGIALLSYDGKLCWGFSADRDVVPDLHDLVECLQREFDQLCTLAGLPVAKSTRLRSVSSEDATETVWTATAEGFAADAAAAAGS